MMLPASMICLTSSGASSGGSATPLGSATALVRSEEHTSELQSLAYLVCRLLLEKKKSRAHRGHRGSRLHLGGTTSRRVDRPEGATRLHRGRARNRALSGSMRLAQ